MINTRFFGRVFISNHLLKSVPGEVIEILSGLLILKADVSYDRGGIEYFAWSKRYFRELKVGESIPEYNIIKMKKIKEHFTIIFKEIK